MATGIYVVAPRDLLPDFEELDIVVAGPPRGAATDVLVSIGVAGGLIAAAADTVTVLINHSEAMRLARRLWTRGRRPNGTKKIVLEARQGPDRLNISFELTGPDTELAADVFVRGFAAALTTMIEKQNDGQ